MSAPVPAPSFRLRACRASAGPGDLWAPEVQAVPISPAVRLPPLPRTWPQNSGSLSQILLLLSSKSPPCFLLDPTAPCIPPLSAQPSPPGTLGLWSPLPTSSASAPLLLLPASCGTDCPQDPLPEKSCSFSKNPRARQWPWGQLEVFLGP